MWKKLFPFRFTQNNVIKAPLMCSSIFTFFPTFIPQALGAGGRGQSSPLLPGDLCLHCGGGEAAGGSTSPQPREAAGAHPGNASHLCMLAMCGCTYGCLRLQGGLTTTCPPPPAARPHENHILLSAGLKTSFFQFCSSARDVARFLSTA